MAVSYDKRYHFFKDQLYDLMYTEDENEINYYRSSDSYVCRNQYPTKQDKLLYDANIFFKILCVLLLELILLTALLLIPGVSFTIIVCFLTNIWFPPALIGIWTANSYKHPGLRA